ncbi:MAG TPA: histidine kinase [Acidobacteriota bacterium]|jgi:signal transduction histidine kinase|nr:histidine kinase [Acidobacteriota bacterium]
MNQDNLPSLGLVMKAMAALLGFSTFYKAFQTYFIRRAENDPVAFLHPFIWEATGHFATLLLIPLIYLFIRRYPITGPKRWLLALLHLAVSMAFSIIDTTAFYEARLWIYDYFDLGSYSYGNVYYRYLYEFQVFVVLYWLFYGALHLYAYVNENRKRQIRTAQLEAELNQARLDVLKTQINPHFLFNTLNTISSVMYENVSAADRMISLLSQMLRRTLDRAQHQVVPLRDDVEILELYLEIMRARFGDRLSTCIEIPENAGRALVPSFLLQPLVENSIKFNPVAGERVAEIVVRAEVKGNWLELVIEDNGPGLGPRFRPGTGLRNIQSRLDHIYGKEYRMEMRNKPEGGLNVTIRVPYTPADQESVTVNGELAEAEAHHA